MPFEEFLWDIPPITRCFLGISLALSAMVSLDIYSPFSFYFNWRLISQKAEVSTEVSPR